MINSKYCVNFLERLNHEIDTEIGSCIAAYVVLKKFIFRVQHRKLVNTLQSVDVFGNILEISN